MKLLDYHRLRREEEEGWNRDCLRAEAGAAFIAAVEQLLPTQKEKFRPDSYIQFTREPWFEKCLELCDRYAAATASQRTWLRARLDQRIAGCLGVFVLRVSVLAAREHSPSLSRAALIAYAINDLTGHDIRDVLIGFSLVVHCAGIAGADVPSLLREVAFMSGPAMSTLYQEWADRYPDVQSIGSMGWRQVETEYGVGFRQ